MSDPRPRTDGGNAVVRLRRCSESLPLTQMLYQNTVPRTVAPLELEIAQSLPDLCSRHGRPAVSRQSIRVCFYDTRLHPRSPRAGIANPATKQLAPVSTIVVGRWPVCERCERSTHRYRRIAAVLMSLMAVNLAALLIVVTAGWVGFDVDALIPPLVWAFFPGSVPLGLAAAVWLVNKGIEPVTFRPIDDERFASVQAHPNFRAAIQAAAGGVGG
ncbi:hypothetical protein [Nocardia amikacinitolerans]|uniref:hypothetical protein n=1 Tax=Nocardia amikacinitolerans TaxID=756689 RepID=UPI0012ECC5D0|nr:hypothetical protein [Nocardia amikacinitolerans]